tara:strand:- start:531 stop:782 length:252 start_codon:yes stop_codon:yes gene_type:complete
MDLNLQTLLRATGAEYLNSARNGRTGANTNVARSIRLPPEVWEDVKKASEALRTVFPNRYVTVNSTVQFLIAEGLRSLHAENA